MQYTRLEKLYSIWLGAHVAFGFGYGTYRVHKKSTEQKDQSLLKFAIPVATVTRMFGIFVGMFPICTPIISMKMIYDMKRGG